MPTTRPSGAFCSTPNWKSGAVNQGASLTFSTASVHVAMADSGAPSMPASVTRTWTAKLGVFSKSKEKAEYACAV